MKNGFLPNSQQIYLSVDGRVLLSCDSIFLTSKAKNKMLQYEIPFLQSLWQNITTSEFPFYKDFNIEGVFLSFGKVKGYFDVHFMKIHLDNQEAVFWHLQDKTPHYTKAIKKQQISNEDYIFKR
jgi:hypothetical protein